MLLAYQRCFVRARRQRSSGFTLLEVMIVVAIIGILGAIAYPSYQNYIRRAKRAAAESVLLDLAAKQQAYLIDQRAYATSLSSLGFTAPPQEISGDFAFDVTPKTAATPPVFSVTATPISSLMLADHSCGMSATVPLALDQAGNKTPSACWQK
ncbi:MAG: type IV pilin protein [Betaproteobacteria bacterium]|nr:type IV pilin protein [Betaproteobacteria bacterium]